MIIFIPQVTSEHHGDDDRITADKIYGLLKNKNDVYLLKNRYSHQEIKAIYSNLDLLVGTRFHSVIFSLISYASML